MAKMTKNIIKSSGTINEILNQLKTLQAIFGKGATLSTVARYKQVKNTIEKQLNKI